jgi:hypothetical protein
VTHSLGIVIESLVSLLLLLTIAYCALLNRQLSRLKADDSALKATISELISATGLAERAIAGLKLTVRDCDQGLGERLRAAQHLSAEMDRQLAAGENFLSRLSRIISAAQPGRAGQNGAASAETKSIVVAAQAFADRTRPRPGSRAA